MSTGNPTFPTPGGKEPKVNKNEDTKQDLKQRLENEMELYTSIAIGIYLRYSIPSAKSAFLLLIT